MKDLGHEDPPIPGGYTGMPSRTGPLKVCTRTWNFLANAGQVIATGLHYPLNWRLQSGHMLILDETEPRNPLAEELCK